jgi:hypothetical protein
MGGGYVKVEVKMEPAPLLPNCTNPLKWRKLASFGNRNLMPIENHCHWTRRPSLSLGAHAFLAEVWKIPTDCLHIELKIFTEEEGTNLLCGIVVTPFLWMCQATMPHMGIHQGRTYLLVGLTITISMKMRTSSLKLTMSTHQWTYWNELSASKHMRANFTCNACEVSRPTSCVPMCSLSRV